MKRQIYIAQAWTFDEEGRFGDEIDRTGILVQGDDIEILETVESGE